VKPVQVDENKRQAEDERSRLITEMRGGLYVDPYPN
jgi:hypothetical protein